jgi:hypothetical protein
MSAAGLEINRCSTLVCSIYTILPGLFGRESTVEFSTVLEGVFLRALSANGENKTQLMMPVRKKKTQLSF